MKKYKKILVIRLGAIGDVVMSTIIASAIKLKHPDYQVHYLTSTFIAPLIENHPHIDKVYTWNRGNKNSKRQLINVGLKLMKERYDIVYNLTYAIRNIIFGLMTLCPRVIYRNCSNKSWVDDYFLTAKKGIKDLEQPNRLYLGVDENALEKVKNYMFQYPRPYIIFTPGGATNNNRQGRMWKLDNWGILAKELVDRYGGTIFICGSKSEKPLHEKILSEKLNIKVLSGEYNLTESSAVFSLGDIIISNDTGPIHIASAHNIKAISLLGSTSPDKIKPYGENGFYLSGDFECKYCWKKTCKYIKPGGGLAPCMESITPSMVINKIEEEGLLK